MNFMQHYILNDAGEPIPCDDFMEWAQWFETAHRQIGKTVVGQSVISTVFLGLDHAFSGQGDPILWETMVFGGGHDGQTRCAGSREQAEAMHAQMVAKIKAATPWYQKLFFTPMARHPVAVNVLAALFNFWAGWTNLHTFRCPLIGAVNFTIAGFSLGSVLWLSLRNYKFK